MGTRRLELDGPHLGRLRESNDALGDWSALRRRMDEDGYLFIRGLHDRAEVLEARRQMLECLRSKGDLSAEAPLMDGVIAHGHDHVPWGQDDLKNCPAFQAVVDGAPIMDFFAGFLAGAPMTYDYKWLRVVGEGGFTGAHVDVVYMGRGTHDLFSCWTPFGDIPIAMGPLAINCGSHRLPGFAKVRDTYGRMDVDRDHVQGWFSDDPIEIVEKFGGRWLTADFRAGDALIFGMFTMHASLTNTTNRFRLSSDTRYQLASVPADERWIGEKPIAHYAWDTPGKNVSMEAARAKWEV